MTPEEMKRLMEIIDRTPGKWIPAEGRVVFEKRPAAGETCKPAVDETCKLEAEETRKVMSELQERLEKLLAHEQQKLQEFEEILHRHFPPAAG